MFTFKVLLRRYSDRNGENRISLPQWVRAASFAEAHRSAEFIISGLRGADPEAKFEIHSIAEDGVFTLICDGSLMFETAEELSARVAKREEA